MAAPVDEPDRSDGRTEQDVSQDVERGVTPWASEPSQRVATQEAQPDQKERNRQEGEDLPAPVSVGIWCINGYDPMSQLPQAAGRHRLPGQGVASWVWHRHVDIVHCSQP